MLDSFTDLIQLNCKCPKNWLEAVGGAIQLSIQLERNGRLVTGCYTGYSNGTEFKFQFCPITLLEQHNAQWT